MKQRIIYALSLGLLMSQVSFAGTTNTTQGATAKAAANALSQSDKVSYTIGVDIGENLKAQSMDINSDLLTRGIKDAISGKELMMSKEQMQQTLLDFQKQMVEKQKAQLGELKDKNAKQGDDFLAKNKKQSGVKTLSSGLQYKVISKGKGDSPKENDYVTVEYEGKLVSGDVFDSTYKRGKPVNFQVSQVIAGWQEALQRMKPGATWELYIPPSLAYGERGLGGPIGPNETLIFKVHLISVGKDQPSTGDATDSTSKKS